MKLKKFDYLMKIILIIYFWNLLFSINFDKKISNCSGENWNFNNKITNFDSITIVAESDRIQNETDLDSTHNFKALQTSHESSDQLSNSNSKFYSSNPTPKRLCVVLSDPFPNAAFSLAVSDNSNLLLTNYGRPGEIMFFINISQPENAGIIPPKNHIYNLSVIYQ